LLDLTPIGGVLSQAEAALTDSDTPRLDAELLLAHTLDKRRTWLHTWPDRPVSREQADTFEQLLRRRLQGEPIAHILGQQPFWTLDLKVTADTLIPRPESELLVEQALSLTPEDQPWQIADLGTGSGAIALAIASERPMARLIATDQSQAALAVARENATAHGLDNVVLRHGSWFEPLQGERFALILSNPPYIAAADPHLGRGDLRFEPDSALRSGSDGLDDLRQIVAGAPGHLQAGGWLMVEHGYDQGNAVRSLFQQHRYQAIATRRDLGGQERITCGVRP
jgi:release factor glutamine methyltransferase